jgi:hypothetical protein
MSTHHDRIRIALLIADIEDQRRLLAGESPVSALDLTQRLERLGSTLQVSGPGERSWLGTAEDLAWKFVLYDATLAQLCDRAGIPHRLADDSASPGHERVRAEERLHDAGLLPHLRGPTRPAEFADARATGTPAAWERDRRSVPEPEIDR